MIQNLNKGYPSFSEKQREALGVLLLISMTQARKILQKSSYSNPNEMEFFNDNIKKLSDFKTRPETNIQFMVRKRRSLVLKQFKKL
jgi:hypothetical protein